MCDSFTASRASMPLDSSSSSSSNTAVNYKSETKIVDSTTLEQPLPVRKTIPKPSKRTEIMVEELTSLDELKWFLEEDERPVVIKFYAKWCKKCQQLGLKFNRLAMDLGDRIVDQQFIDGDVRFAAIEYNQDSHGFVTEELQIRGFPTLQVYVGTNKLLEAGSSVPNVRKELAVIEGISHADLLKRATEADDGVLTGLIEESFYDSPDFLNEEW
eukprot:CAMPEP_0197178056 /NCGR_PEP_ID=MMETSP1423-20130617/3447_1 /TAXON_ID=476441 /ORGANISM="Pseudo-nitzschia heimii, Strain UNC1101" /LENGTH=213 /DNA_ID=CAMNT_0042627711 /DNA_START=408 /DNA_END=1049 /DNA_ORIENTATION=-